MLASWKPSIWNFLTSVVLFFLHLFCYIACYSQVFITFGRSKLINNSEHKEVKYYLSIKIKVKNSEIYIQGTLSEYPREITKVKNKMLAVIFYIYLMAR